MEYVPPHPPTGPTPPRGPLEQVYQDMFERTYADVLRFVQRRVHPTHAEDVTADAFLVAWRRVDELPRRPGDQRAWLFGIARNCLLNARRAVDRQHALAVRIADATTTGHRADPRGAAVTPDLVAAALDLAAAWRRLPPADQEVLALTAFDELTSPQAGRVLGIGSAAYRLRLMRARRRLRAELDPTLDAPPLTPRLGSAGTPPTATAAAAAHDHPEAPHDQG